MCGGYQLLGRFYRDRGGEEQPGAGVLPLYTVAGERRMIGDVLLECELEPGVVRTVAGFENHAGRTILDDGAEPLGRVVAGFGNDGASGYEGCRLGRAIGTYLHGPLLPRNPWLADWLLEQALAHRTGEAPVLEPLEDELEAEAHGVSSARARSRGGRPAVPTDSRPRPPPRDVTGSTVLRSATCSSRGSPEGAEVDARVAGLPAGEEALDRRMEHDLFELRDREQPMAAHGSVLRRRPLERPAGEVARRR